MNAAVRGITDNQGLRENGGNLCLFSVIGIPDGFPAGGEGLKTDCPDKHGHFLFGFVGCSANVWRHAVLGNLGRVEISRLPDESRSYE